MTSMRLTIRLCSMPVNQSVCGSHLRHLSPVHTEGVEAHRRASKPSVRCEGGFRRSVLRNLRSTSIAKLSNMLISGLTSDVISSDLDDKYDIINYHNVTLLLVKLIVFYVFFFASSIV